MKTRLQRCKNSNGIKISSNILKSLNLKPNDKKYHLRKVFQNIKDENLVKNFNWYKSK